MIEEAMFLLFGLLVAFNVGHFMTLRECKHALLRLSFDAKTVSDFDPGNLVDVLRDEVAGMVGDALHNMRTPTIADHLGGVISQFAQMRLMKEMQQSGMLTDAYAQSIEPEIVND